MYKQMYKLVHQIQRRKAAPPQAPRSISSVPTCYLKHTRSKLEVSTDVSVDVSMEVDSPLSLVPDPHHG